MDAVTVDIQRALSESEASVLPSEDEIQHWVKKILHRHPNAGNELTIRFVENNESQSLNSAYRQKHKPTNVLSFPFENPPGIELPLLGDLVICVPVIIKEADEQNKSVLDHFAHMIVHGCLHLLSYDHTEESDAEEMEALEIAILAELGIDDPYQPH